MNDGTVIRLIFPELTEERRNDLSKDIKKMSEEAKIAVRAIRGDEMKDAKNQLKDKAISEDEEKALEDKIQKATDKFIDIIDQVTDKKVKEIMTV
jgi:ribosome recycling factor